LVGFFSFLGTNCVLLRGHWLASVEAAVLEYHSGIAKDEVHSVVDVTFPEELVIGVNVGLVWFAEWLFH
jgi:hypothetical protein